MPSTAPSSPSWRTEVAAPRPPTMREQVGSVSAGDGSQRPHSSSGDPPSSIGATHPPAASCPAGYTAWPRLPTFFPPILLGEPRPLRPPLPSTPRPQLPSSPISFSLTLGGKLAIYGAPSESGGHDADATTEKGTESAEGRDEGSFPPGPRDRGEGRGRSLQLLPTAPGQLRKVLDQTTKSHTNN